ncbi:MAG: hypothetical protein ACI8V9_000775 [Flavobacteriaceae bacterium]|jgi:hypothetical protein
MKIGLRTLVSFLIVVILSSFSGIYPSIFANRSSDLFSISDIDYTVGAIKDLDMDMLIPFTGKSYVGFKEALAFKESQGNYASVNTLGYMGKYQFGKNTLAFYGQYNTECFIQDPALQEKIFYHNTARNKWILRRDIKRFVGLEINGIVISESGMLAAAHLAGAGNVKKYLRSWGDHNFSDSYNTSIEDYLRRFSGYDLKEVESRQRVLFS